VCKYACSEEVPEPIDMEGEGFSVAFDPLDGSSIVDTNFTVRPNQFDTLMKVATHRPVILSMPHVKSASCSATNGVTLSSLVFAIAATAYAGEVSFWLDRLDLRLAVECKRCQWALCSSVFTAAVLHRRKHDQDCPCLPQVGTIFGVWPGDKLKGITGRDQAAAGMGVFGPRTCFVIALKDAPGCHEFLLQVRTLTSPDDPDIAHV